LKRKIGIQASARNDLIGIWRYSARQWDEQQADQYLDQLDKAIQNLAENPDLGVKRDYIREGYRVLFAGRHAIYYTAMKGAIRIVRVLHAQMDPDRYL
jgi:toxin ParE1/3/4